jgi:hypothetical protein
MLYATDMQSPEVAGFGLKYHEYDVVFAVLGAPEGHGIAAVPPVNGGS